MSISCAGKTIRPRGWLHRWDNLAGGPAYTNDAFYRRAE